MSEIETTPVMFRRVRSGDFKGVVTAVFPEQVEGFGYVASFAHIGQHSPASWEWVLTQTRPATPDQYADLKRELEAEPYGYRLKVIKRRPRR